ncbi:MAG: hypothetical protein R3A48_17505 [Polyangiales bacterium]
MPERRALPSLLVFLSTALVSGALSAGVYARGLAFTLGPIGAAAHAPAVAVMTALMALALVRLKGLSRAQSGLVFTRRDGVTLAVTTALTALWLVGFIALVGALTGAPLARSANAVSVAALATALASFVGSAAIQQLTTQSLALAASPSAGASRGGVAGAPAVFTLAHAPVSAAPRDLLNVALFGLASTSLFLAPKRPSYALPLGLHAGWNWAQLAVLGAPFGDGANPVAILRWPAASPTLVGGAHGFDEGALFAVALLPFFALARWRRTAA